MTANPKSTLGRGKSHKCFKISDEYCSLVFGLKNGLLQVSAVHNHSLNCLLWQSRPESRQSES